VPLETAWMPPTVAKPAWQPISLWSLHRPAPRPAGAIPHSGNSGTITLTRSYQAQNGEYCREYRQTVTIDNETQVADGTACRQPDGKWRIVQ
jgi:hypothetical protein